MLAANHIDVLVAARRVADFASNEGALQSTRQARATYTHMGAVIADSVLQAGLNYNSVVRPRVLRILHSFPETNTVQSLMLVVEERRTAELLDWQHPTKAQRFEDTVLFCHEHQINNTIDLREHLSNESFCADIQSIKGIGPKTVDYMSCLVGIDSIAVDRHIRSFADKVGVAGDEYIYLKKVFCFAADLLSIPRRDFDAWIWSKQSQEKTGQLHLSF